MDNNNGEIIKTPLPFSNLVLFAKGWIYFPWINTKNGGKEEYYRALKCVLTLDDFIVFNNSSVNSLLLMAVDRIKEVCDKYNHPFPYELSNFRNFISGVHSCQALNDIDDFDYAMVRYIISKLTSLEIGNRFLVRRVDYKSNKIKRVFDEISTTYTKCQKDFDLTFKSMLNKSPYSASSCNYSKLRKII